MTPRNETGKLRKALSIFWESKTTDNEDLKGMLFGKWAYLDLNKVRRLYFLSYLPSTSTAVLIVSVVRRFNNSPDQIP